MLTNKVYPKGNTITEMKLFLMTMVVLAGFQLYFLPTNICYILFFLLFWWGGFTRYWNVKIPFVLPILLYCLCLTVSFVYSAIYNNQNFITSVSHSYLYFGPLFYFILLRYKPTLKQVEKFLVLLSVVYCLCYIAQYLLYPTIIFKSADTININEQRFRMRLMGSICSYLLFFYGINNYLLIRRFKYLFFVILAAVPILIMGFRSLVVTTLVFSFIMIPFVVKSSHKTIVFALLAAGAVYLSSHAALVQNKISEMEARQEANQTLDNEDYIRYASLAYYWDYFDKPGEKIIGAGIPIDNNSQYKKDISYAVEYYGYYWVDLGLIGLVFVIGLPAVLLLVFIYFYCIWHCKNPQSQFVRFTLIVVFICSIFTTKELYREGNLVVLPILLYYVYKDNELQSSKKPI